MPLASASSRRSLVHTRSVRFPVYRREDGLHDIEGQLVDVKSIDCQLPSGLKKAGEPMHDMSIRLTFDRDLTIVAAVPASDTIPYGRSCRDATLDCAKLVGLNFANGYRKAVLKLLGGVRGCTHMSEMLLQFPTVALQTLAEDRPGATDADGKPFPLDRCRALDTQGEAVRQYFPSWYRGVKADA